MQKNLDKIQELDFLKKNAIFLSMEVCRNNAKNQETTIMQNAENQNRQNVKCKQHVECRNNKKKTKMQNYKIT